MVDSASTNASSRSDGASRAAPRNGSSSQSNREKKQSSAPAPKPMDFSITVKGRFDPDLRRFFVTILDTSSQTLITQFPSQAVARYVQQLRKNVAEGEETQGEPQKTTDIGNSADPKLNRTT